MLTRFQIQRIRVAFALSHNLDDREAWSTIAHVPQDVRLYKFHIKWYLFNQIVGEVTLVILHH
jgi:hypothetical protein